VRLTRSKKPWGLAAIAALTATAVVGLAGAGSSGAATPSANLPTGKVNIPILWWGETEAPGSQKWLKNVEAAYSKLHPNVTFQNSLESTDGYLPALTAAETAKKGPVITYLWGGSYTMDAVWKGAIVPISDLVGMSEAKHYLNHDEATWDGKIWSAAWYNQPSYPIIYNKKALAAIGLKAYPKTIASLLTACKASAAKGVPFIGLGIKDKWGVGRAAQDMLGQTITNVGQILASTSGSTNFNQPAYTQFFSAWQQMSASKCFPDDVKSLDMYSGQQRVITGKAVSTYITGSEVASYVKNIGAANAGVALPPKIGSGPYAGKIGATSQTLAVTSWSSNDQKAIAADFIMFMHKPAQLQSYYATTGVQPADDRFNTNSITLPQVKSVATWAAQKGSPETENYFPYDVSWNGYNEAQAEIVTGKIKTVNQMVAMTESAAGTWRKSNRLLLGQYKKWAQQKSGSGG
jgi:raffinose/stachyose/melibiose transport system substrate-binding protein